MKGDIIIIIFNKYTESNLFNTDTKGTGMNICIIQVFKLQKYM